jgi:AcrR family transcriptional regulator
MPASTPSASLRKAPRQNRSRETVEIILQAASQLLEKRGEPVLTTALIAARAGVSIGTFYQYFADLNALLLALAEQERTRLAERLRDLHVKLEAGPSPQSEREFIEALVKFYARRKGASRQFALLAHVQALTRQWPQDQFAEMLVNHWTLHRKSSRAKKDEIHAYVLTRALTGILQSAAIESSPWLDAPEFYDALYLIIKSLRRIPKRTKRKS